MRFIKVSSIHLRTKLLQATNDPSNTDYNDLSNYLSQVLFSYTALVGPTDVNLNYKIFFETKIMTEALGTPMREFLDLLKTYVDDKSALGYTGTDSINVLSVGTLATDADDQYDALKKVIEGRSRRGGLSNRPLRADEIDELSIIVKNIANWNKDEVIQLINYLETNGSQRIRDIITRLKAAGKITDSVCAEAAAEYGKLSTLLAGIGLDNISSISSSVRGKIRDLQDFSRKVIYTPTRLPGRYDLDKYRSEETSGFKLSRNDGGVEIYQELKNNVLIGLDHISQPLGVSLFLSIFGNSVDQAAAYV